MVKLNFNFLTARVRAAGSDLAEGWYGQFPLTTFLDALLGLKYN